MANLIKTANGLLFYDDFSQKTLMWTLSPSYAKNVLEFGDKGLRLKHSDNYCIYTMVEPENEEFSCIVQLDHIPYNVDDIAGIIVLSNDKEYAECQSYMATEPSGLENGNKYYQSVIDAIEDTVDDYLSSNTSTPSTIQQVQTIPFTDTLYKYIKFNKMKYKYVFYASSDGTDWIEIGNVSFNDSSVVGFFIYSTTDQDIIQNSHCYFNNFALYKSKYFVFEGIDRLNEIEMYDGDGNIVFKTDTLDFLDKVSRWSKTCSISTNMLPMPIKNARIRIYPRGKYAETISEYELGDVWGGDEFTLTRDIKVFINGNQINTNEIYNIGAFYRGSHFVKLVIENSDNEIVSDIKVKVIRYSEYYAGEEAIGIALYDENETASTINYTKEVTINALQPSENRTIMIKLVDRPVHDFYMTANDYRFKIVIE